MNGWVAVRMAVERSIELPGFSACVPCNVLEASGVLQSLRSPIMRFTLLSLSLLFTTFANAQTCSWLTGSPMAYAANPSMPMVAVGSAPGYLVASRQLSGIFAYGADIYGEAVLEQLDPLSGAVLWSCPLNDSVNVESVAVGADGVAYYAGRFMGSLALCDGSTLSVGQGAPLYTVHQFMIAVDLNTGLLKWSRDLSLQHPEGLSVPSIAIDPQGRMWYAMAGWGSGEVVRVDEFGADVELRTIEGVRSFGTISFDPWGGLYVSGSVDDNGFTFADVSYADYGGTGYNMFLVRYRPDGSAGFASFAADITFQDPTVVATTDGHAYLAGNLFEATSWGDVAFTGPNWGDGMFLVRMDSTGVFEWGVESTSGEGSILGDMSRSKGPCITIDAANNLVLLGEVRGVVDWGSGYVSGSGQLTDRVITVVSFNPDGYPIWVANSTIGSGYKTAQSITAAAIPGAVYMAGHVRDPFTFGPHNVNEVDQQAAVFAMLVDLPTTLNVTSADNSMNAWPVPARTQVVLQVQQEHVGPAKLLASDGRTIRSLNLRSVQEVLDVQDLPPGAYFIRAANGAVVRIVKE